MASKPARIAFNKLLNAMRKLSVEVNDYEICKRLEILMLTSKDDLPSSNIKSLIDNPLDFEPKEINEPYTQYVRHFIYMVKRNERQGNPPIGYGSDADGSLSSLKNKQPKAKRVLESKAAVRKQKSIQSNNQSPASPPLKKIRKKFNQ